MKLGYLSQYFDAVASKRLSAVETDPSRSHQHEFNGVKKLTHMFGIPSEKQTFPATFLYLCDDEYDATPESGFVTWSDYRSTPPKNTRDKIWLSGKRRSPECRLYYPTTTMSMNMAEGDLLVIAKRPNGHILVIVAEAGSDIERQLCWLFNLGNPQLNISLRVALETEQDRLGFASRVVLEAIGVTVEDSDETWLDRMLRDFNGQFPDTSTFSLFARDTMPDIADADLKGDPDRVLLEWCTREEILFRTLEKHLVAERLRKGFFGEDAFDEFDELSKQVTNRRKSRAGRALENHLEHMFKRCRIRYTRGGRTENHAKPDFLFPGVAEYHQSTFPVSLLTMLGVKNTCRDRWRQVLAEATRISPKHLLTLEPAITVRQTDEMASQQIRLVVPREIQSTYDDKQRPSLLSVADFLRHVEKKQSAE